jgi:hypothetical protein
MSIHLMTMYATEHRPIDNLSVQAKIHDPAAHSLPAAFEIDFVDVRSGTVLAES